MRKVMRQVRSGRMPDLGALMRQGTANRPPVARGSQLRLTRIGGRKNPIWRVVVADQRSKRDGRVIETIGHYNAQTNPSTIVLDEERIRDWLGRGRSLVLDRRKLLRTQNIT